MRKEIWALLFIAILMGCAGKDEMDAVIEKGLSVSVEQSKLMAKSIWEQKTLLPRTLDKEGKLIRLEVVDQWLFSRSTLVSV